MSGLKPFVLILVLFAAMLAACQSQAAQPGAVEPPATSAPEEATPPSAESPSAEAITAAATAFLAEQLGLTEADVQLISAEMTEFNDGCLGLGGPAESCLQVITPGWTLKLSANGQEYEVRTDATGEQVRVAGDMAGMGGQDAITAAATAFLAEQLGLTEADVQLISAEMTEFNDGCLGLGGPAESCLQAITPGWVVYLSANDQEYEVRTDATGEQVRVAGDTGESNDAITASAAAVLADELGIDPATITVVSAEPAEFSNSCLGLGGPDEMCAEVITPGWIVTLSAGGQEYTAHTDATAVQVRLAGDTQ